MLRKLVWREGLGQLANLLTEISQLVIARWQGEEQKVPVRK